MVYRLCNTHKASSVYLCCAPLRNTRLRGVVGPKQQNEGLACRGIGRGPNILRDSFEKKSFTHTSPILQKVRNFYRAPPLGDLPALARQKPQASRKAQTLVDHDLEIYPHFFCRVVNLQMTNEPAQRLSCPLVGAPGESNPARQPVGKLRSRFSIILQPNTYDNRLPYIVPLPSRRRQLGNRERNGARHPATLNGSTGSTYRHLITSRASSRLRKLSLLIPRLFSPQPVLRSQKDMTGCRRKKLGRPKTCVPVQENLGIQDIINIQRKRKPVQR